MADEANIADPQIDCHTGDGYPERVAVGEGDLLEKESHG